MIINARPLNKNEIFCCNINDIKEFFKDTEIRLNLGGTKHFILYYKNMSYFRKNIKGKIVAEMFVQVRNPKAGINFYVFKENEISDNLKKEFAKTILPKLFKFYEDKINCQISDEATLNYNVIVELYNGKFNIHTVLYNS